MFRKSEDQCPIVFYKNFRSLGYVQTEGTKDFYYLLFGFICKCRVEVGDLKPFDVQVNGLLDCLIIGIVDS